MRYLIAALLFCAVCLLESCKEGCKDKHALNYDSKASAENGTCLYCKDTFVADTATYFFTSSRAQNTSSPALEFILITTNSNISGNGCKTIGKQPTSTCKNYLSLVNLTNQRVDGSFDVEFTQNGAFEWFFSENSFLVMGPPGSGTDTLNFGIADSIACSNLTSGTLTPNIVNLQFF